MKKILLFLMIVGTMANAGLIDAIAIKVKDDIITLQEIDKKMKAENISKQKAVNNLVDDILFKQELKDKQISVSQSDVDDYIKNIARSNKMTFDQFKQAVNTQISYKNYSDNIKKNLLKTQLSKKILTGKLRYANDEDIKIYYENNKKLFKIASKIDVVKYIAQDKNLLIQVLKNPMYFNANIQRENMTIDMKTTSKNIIYFLNGIDVGKFTKVAKIKNEYIMYYVKEKKDNTLADLDLVKNKIFKIIMKTREKQFLKNHFSKMRLEANIKVLR